jgi:dCMP deaminase
VEKAIKEIYKHRQDFIIIGLTGRIGSGCSTVAKIMQNNVDSFGIEQVGIAQNATDELRKKHIILKFFQKNWQPFYTIRASDIIFSFILEKDLSFFDEYIKKCDVNVDITTIEDKFSAMKISTIQILEKLNNKINIEDIEALDELHNYSTFAHRFQQKH